MAGLLQNEFEGDYKVLNHSISGWGHSQSYLRFDDIKENLDESDILIFIYAQYLLPRNAPQPSVLKSLSNGLRFIMKNPDSEPMIYPGFFSLIKKENLLKII